MVGILKETERKEFHLTLQYSFKGKSEGTWIVDPENYIEITANSLVELLSKLSISIVQLQQKLHEDAMLELRMLNDDIPF